MRCEEALPNNEGTASEERKLRRLRVRSRQIEATVWIGKDGASEDLLLHVRNQLKARELVKLKVHKSALNNIDTGGVAEKVADGTASTLVDVIGHTFTLYKKKERATTPAKPR